MDEDADVVQTEGKFPHTITLCKFKENKCMGKIDEFIIEFKKEIEPKDEEIAGKNPTQKSFRIKNDPRPKKCDGNVWKAQLLIEASKARVDKNKEDNNSGEIIFYFIGNNETNEDSSKGEPKSFSIYCTLQSGLSSVWQTVSKHKDFDFPKLFVEHFLNEEKVSSTEVEYFVGRNPGILKTLYTDVDKLDKHKLMNDYGIVKTLKASIDGNTQQGQELLLKLLFEDNTKPQEQKVTMQSGQVKIPSYNNIHENIIPFIHKHMYVTKTNNNKPWEILRYFVEVPKEVAASLEKEIIEELQKSYEDSNYESQKFERSSLLNPILQDTFRSSYVTLFYGMKKLEWQDGAKNRGEDVTIDVLLKSLHKNKKKTIETIDFKKVKIKFYDRVGECYVRTCVLDMIRTMQFMKNGKGEIANKCFHFGKRYFQVNGDAFFNKTAQFVNLVQKVLDNEEKVKVLPWYVKEKTENKNPVEFNIDDLYEHISTKKLDTGKKEELLKILQEKFVLVKVNGDKEFENNFADNDTINNNNSNSNDTITGNSTSNNDIDNNTHNSFLLGMNRKILNSSWITSDKNISNKLSDFLNSSKGTSKFTYKDFRENVSNDEEKVKKLLDRLQEEKPTLKKLSEDKYSVANPYMTKDVVMELNESLGNEICIVKLLQFLRSRVPLYEGDYNELYHLGNCHDKDWKYVVGDRILSNKFRFIELFDVMAYNEKDKKIYFLHVKDGFDGSSARALCSQVSNCGNLIWAGFTVNSKFKDILELFYEYVNGISENGPIHTILTKREVESIGNTTEEFQEKIISSKCIVCLSPCFKSSTRNLRTLRNANLFHVFQDSDFCRQNENNVDYVEMLKDKKMLDSNKKITPAFLDTKDNFLRVMKDSINNECEFVYGKLKEKVCGTTGASIIDQNSSFVAVMSFIDMYKTFSTFFFNGDERIKLCILEIPSLLSDTSSAGISKKKRKQQPNSNEAKRRKLQYTNESTEQQEDQSNNTNSRTANLPLTQSTQQKEMKPSSSKGNKPGKNKNSKNKPIQKNKIDKYFNKEQK